MNSEDDDSQKDTEWQDKLQQIMRDIFSRKQQGVADPQPIPRMIADDMHLGGMDPKDWHYHNQMSVHFLGRSPDLVEMAVLDTDELSVDPDFSLPSPKCLLVSATSHLYLIAKIFGISIAESLEVLVEFVSLTSARHAEGYGIDGVSAIADSLAEEDQQKDTQDDDENDEDECVDWIDR